MAPSVVLQDEHTGFRSLPWTCLTLLNFSLTVHISTSEHLLPQLLAEPRERCGRIKMVISTTVEDNLSSFESRSLFTPIKTKSLWGSSEVSLTERGP